MERRTIHARLIAATGALRLRMSQRMRNGEAASFDVMLPVERLMQVDGVVKVVVDGDWLNSLGPNVIDGAPAELKAGHTIVERSAVWRKLCRKYHPDVAIKGSLFAPEEIMADINDLISSLRRESV